MARIRARAPEHDASASVNPYLERAAQVADWNLFHGSPLWQSTFHNE
jgi:hypothetical protein